MAGSAAATFASAAAGSTALPPNAAAQTAALLRFPTGFLWGCATAAYQIEGAANEDGRGPSVWDTFSHTPGKTFHGDTGDVADDSYHLYKEDVKLLKNLGVKVYRFSISWSRIFPDGTGQPNEKGLAYYQRVVDELLANNIEPYITLFHWDLPQALPGGWESRDTSKAFADYAGYVSKRLSDRIHHFFTTNEFVCFTDLSYKSGQFAPGMKLPAAQVNQIRHNGILAHGLGVQAIRANAKSGTQVGLAENANVYAPGRRNAANTSKPRRRATREGNAPFLTARDGRQVHRRLSEARRRERSEGRGGRHESDRKSARFCGTQRLHGGLCAGGCVRGAGYAVEPRQASFPRMASPWLYVDPEAIYWTIRNVSDIWKPRALYITENGCSADDVVTAAGRIEDTDRVMYLRNHLTHLQRAASEGYPIKGYFLWSLLDNYEWADGYSKRFGIHYVDFKTLKRTPKLSAEWYGEVIRRNAVA